jgi:methionine-rich copper-binding protein CopC
MPAQSRRFTGSTGVVLAAVLTGLVMLLITFSAAPASAHDYPVSWSPAAGSTVTRPVTKVSITFDDIVLDVDHDSLTSLLTVTGPSGATRHFETGCTTTLGRTISAPVRLGEAGKYTVSYQIVSADGHPVSGSQTFTFQPPAGFSPAPGTAGPACHRASAQGQGSAAKGATGEAADSAASSAPGVLIGIVGGVVGLAVIAIIVVLVVPARRRQ